MGRREGGAKEPGHRTEMMRAFRLRFARREDHMGSMMECPYSAYATKSIVVRIVWGIPKSSVSELLVLLRVQVACRKKIILYSWKSDLMVPSYDQRIKHVND